MRKKSRIENRDPALAEGAFPDPPSRSERGAAQVQLALGAWRGIGLPRPEVGEEEREEEKEAGEGVGNVQKRSREK